MFPGCLIVNHLFITVEVTTFCLGDFLHKESWSVLFVHIIVSSAAHMSVVRLLSNLFINVNVKMFEYETTKRLNFLICYLVELNAWKV